MHDPSPPSLDEMIAAVRAEILLNEGRLPSVPRSIIPDAHKHIAALRAALAHLEASRWRSITATEPPRHGNYVRAYTEEGVLYCPLGGEATHYLLLPHPPTTASEGEGG